MPGPTLSHYTPSLLFRLAAVLVVSMLGWSISTAALVSPSPDVEAPPRPTAAEALDRQRPAGVSDDTWLALRSAVLESKPTPLDDAIGTRPLRCHLLSLRKPATHRAAARCFRRKT